MSTTLERGTRVGPYAIEVLLGMGGMGAVYRARDTRLGRVVALKVVRPGRVDRTGVDPSDRLLAEAQAAAALRHRNIVEVYDAGVFEGQTYVAMECVEGRPLRACVGDPSVSLDVRLRWLGDTARALGAAHAAGLVHRDVKPENVMIDGEGRARVLDFGIAKRFAHDVSAPTAERPLHLETAEGRVIGTAAYMAPEQLAGGAPDPRWDQFAWGVMAYELLTGVHPRQAVAMPGATAHFTQTPRLPSEVVPGLPFEVGASVLRAMAPDALRRFASMDEVADALRPLPREHGSNASRAAMPSPAAAAEPPGAPPPRVRRGPLVLALLLLLLGGATVITAAVAALLRPPPPPPVVAAAPSAAPEPSPRATPAPSVESIGPEPAEPQGVASSPARVAHGATRPSGQQQQPGADHGTRCECHGKRGSLCTPNASREASVCRCLDLTPPTEDRNLLSLERAWDLSRIAYRGRNLRDGQPCKGFYDGQEKAGVLADCEVDCDRMGFSGLHRGPCTGFRPEDGATEEGYLLCF